MRYLHLMILKKVYKKIYISNTQPKFTGFQSAIPVKKDDLSA